MPRRQPATPATPSTHASGTSAKWSSLTLRSWTVGALPIINHILAQAGARSDPASPLADARWPQPPTRCGRPRRPRAKHPAQPRALSTRSLGGESRSPIARPHARGRHRLHQRRPRRPCLTALFEADVLVTCSRRRRHAVRSTTSILRELHNDSTTVSCYGDYDGSAAQERTLQRPVPGRHHLGPQQRPSARLETTAVHSHANR